MMKKANIVAILSVLVVVGCVTVTNQGAETNESAELAATPETPKPPAQSAVTAKPPVPQPETPQEIVEMSDDFAFNLYRQLLVDNENGNMFFSPFSLSAALGMTYAGARGETEKQMSKALSFPLPQETLHDEMASTLASMKKLGKVKMHTANALWPNKSYKFDAKYMSLVKNKYSARVSKLDYSHPEKAQGTINTWARKNTKGKIKELVTREQCDANTLMVLTNAIYFNGPWGEKFEASRTTNQKFFVTKDKVVEVPMMNRVGQVGYFDDGKVKVLELPYQGERFSLIAILPNLKDGLPSMEKHLSKEQIDKWVSQLNTQKVIINLPKFKIESEFELKKALEALGMVDAFSGAADFSGMQPPKDKQGQGQLSISDVIHKAVVDVSEEGTEAAAATAVVMRKGGMPAKFYPDHPFIFVIRDKETNKDLFIGRVVNPTI